MILPIGKPGITLSGSTHFTLPLESNDCAIQFATGFSVLNLVEPCISLVSEVSPNIELMVFILNKDALNLPNVDVALGLTLYVKTASSLIN